MLGSVFMMAAATSAVQPTSKWLIDFGESHCVASREYGTAERPLTLMLKAPASGDVVQLAIAVAGAGSSNAQQLGGRVAWGNAAPQPTTVLTYRAVSLNRRLFVMNLPRAQVAAASGSDRIAIATGTSQNHILALSSLAPVLDTMDSCVADLRSYWNYEERSPKEPARPTDARPLRALVSLFNSGDYPEDAVRTDGSGTVSTILLVNADGRVADCTLTETSGIAVLDGQTCAVFRVRARYHPATGPDGKPRRSAVKARVRWVLP